MKRRVNLLRLFMPLLVMVLVAGILLAEKRGVDFQAHGPELALLPAQAEGPTKPQARGVPVLILVDGADEIEAPFARTLRETLDAMRMPWREIDIRREALPDLAAFDNVLVCTRSMGPLLADVADLVRWIDAGGHMALCMSPIIDDVFLVLYRILGIVEYDYEYKPYEGLRFTTDIVPLMGGWDYTGDGDLNDYALPVRLESDCVVHMETAEENPAPLLWEHAYGEGRIVVFNTTMMSGKDSRGFVYAVLAAMEDTLAYPIINAGMLFIDDFPAPQPEGYDERLLRDFGYDIQGFFRHHWWPDMKRMAWEYGIAYSGVLIETYNDLVEPPFEPEEEGALLRFYASELLHSGGEIGLHGYNHMSLNFEGFEYPSDVNYKLWPSEENMAEALLELYRYGKLLFPEAEFQTYVPPSNFLSPEGQAVLRRTLPDVRVISGLYLYEEGVPALVQEFGEETDGSISVPRLSSGFIPTEYNRLVIASELAFHGVYSHFIHPDDVLDEARGATSGWQDMFRAYVRMISDISNAYPQLRFATAAGGAAAVQRYERLGVTRTQEKDALQIDLTGLHDTAWFALRTRRTPAHVEGGVLHPVAEGLYWIEVLAPTLRIQWEVEA